MKKECKTCKKLLEEEDFPVNKTTEKKIYRRRKCRDCYNGIKNEYKRKKRVQFNLFKRGLSCASCGYSEKTKKTFTPSALEFHHPNKDKTTTVSNMVNQNGYALPKIVAEIEKCLVLCAVCHREHHAGTLDLKNKETLKNVSKNYKG